MSRAMLTLLPLGALAAQIAIAAAGEEPLPATAERVVVLANGHVLRGTVSHEGDRIVLRHQDGGEIRLPERDVDVISRDLDEAYRARLARIDQRSVVQQLQLAAWCLRQGLLAQSAERWLAASDLEPNHPGLADLESRLRAAVEPPAPSAEAAPAERRHLSQEEVERALRDVSPMVIDAFTSNIQPVLLNRCGAARCHGPAATSRFVLQRSPWGPAMTRPFTQRNLYAVLEMIDRRSPETSPLITTPTVPHGPLKTAVFTERDARQVEYLALWARAAVAPRGGERGTPSTISATKEQLLQRFAPGGVLPELEPPSDHRAAAIPELPDLPEVSAGGPQVNAPAASEPNDSPIVPGSPPPKRSTAKFGADSGKTFVPRDPFDAEIFNRRHFGPPPEDDEGGAARESRSAVRPK
jgi:hypothetical protein